MAENSMWFYKPSDSTKFDPAAQAQAAQRKSAAQGKVASMIDKNEVSNWDKAQVNMLNDKNVPIDYANDKLTNLAKWLDMQMSKATNKLVKHDDPMAYISSNQALHDIQWLKTQYPENAGMQKKLDDLSELVGESPFGSNVTDRIAAEGRNAYKATHGSYLGFIPKSDDKRTKEATAIEYAAAGYKDMLLDIKDVDKLKKAVQSAYVLYNKTGDDRYEDAGALARGMLAKQLGATQAGNYPAQRDFYKAILELSQAADVAVPDSPYVDTARYSIIRDELAKVTAELEKSYSKKDEAASTDVTINDIKNSKGGKNNG